MPVSMEGFGRGVMRAVCGPVELHEDEVPQLQVAVAVALADAAVGSPQAISSPWSMRISEQGPQGPVSPIAQKLSFSPIAHQALLGDPDPVAPEVAGLVVLAKDRDPEPVLGQTHLGGQKFPGVADGLLLEIIAEGEVAQHLEEGVVAGRAPDVFQVVVLAAGADALLGRGGPHVVALLPSQEEVLELVHPGVGEEQGGVVVRDQGRGRNDGVAVLFEIVQKTLADLVTGDHESSVCLSSLRNVRTCAREKPRRRK